MMLGRAALQPRHAKTRTATSGNNKGSSCEEDELLTFMVVSVFVYSMFYGLFVSIRKLSDEPHCYSCPARFAQDQPKLHTLHDEVKTKVARVRYCVWTLNLRLLLFNRFVIRTLKMQFMVNLANPLGWLWSENAPHLRLLVLVLTSLMNGFLLPLWLKEVVIIRFLITKTRNY